MSDYLVQALAYHGQIRAYAVTGSGIVEKAMKQHKTTKPATIALGRALVAVAMMGNMQKGEETVTMKFQGDGPLGSILVYADAKGNVIGRVDVPNVEIPAEFSNKESEYKAIGNTGTLTVIKEMNMKDNFSSQVNFVSSDITENLSHYFAHSEQVSSAVGIGANITNEGEIVAGGFIIQLLPNASEEVVTLLKDRLSNSAIDLSLLEVGITPEEILKKVFLDNELQILKTKPVKFCCTCSKEKLENALVAISVSELNDMKEKHSFTEVRCRFCNENYSFSPEEVEKLISRAEK